MDEGTLLEEACFFVPKVSQPWPASCWVLGRAVAGLLWAKWLVLMLKSLNVRCCRGVLMSENQYFW